MASLVFFVNHASKTSAITSKEIVQELFHHGVEGNDGEGKYANEWHKPNAPFLLRLQVHPFKVSLVLVLLHSGKGKMLCDAKYLGKNWITLMSAFLPSSSGIPSSSFARSSSFFLILLVFMVSRRGLSSGSGEALRGAPDGE